MSGDLIHVAEYVSPGHPDRLADAIAERVVDAALALDADALVGVEVAVHTRKVFIDGRVAAANNGLGTIQRVLGEIVADVYCRAGYAPDWPPCPSDLCVSHDVCSGALSDDERAIRHVSDDQNVVIGWAERDERTNWLPPAHWLAHRLGATLLEWRNHTAADTFGPDFKLLPMLTSQFDPGGRERFVWDRLVVSWQHRTGLPYEEQHRLLLPVLDKALAACERVMPGIASGFRPDVLVLNGAGEFCQGGPAGDNGLSGKKLVVDHYGPSVPIGGGALTGKDPHKIDRAGPLRARQLAKRLVRNGARAARVVLAWAPGDGSPHHVSARIRDAGGLWRDVGAQDLPDREWFSIAQTNRDLELPCVCWTSVLRSGFMTDSGHPWER